MDKEIILFGDLKGTKYFLENNMRSELEARLLIIHEALFECVEEYSNRSANFEAFTFSDSILVRWKDSLEGVRKCIPFSKKLWNKISDLPYRLFIETGDSINETTPIFQQIIRNERYITITPVSYAFWSVCIAEASHFPEGVFLGKKLWTITEEKLSNDVFTAEHFIYRKIIFDTGN